MNIINFGIVKQNIINKLSSNIINENKQNKDFNTFFNVLEQSPILMKEFIVFKNIEDMRIKDDFLASKYIDENVSLFKDIKYADLVKENQKLSNFNVECNLNPDTIKLYNAINNIIVENTIKRGIKSIDKIHESFEVILTHLKREIDPINEEVDNSLDLEYGDVILENIINKFNTEYSNLNENEIEIFNSIIIENEDTKKIVFNKIITETKNKLSTIINNINENDEGFNKLTKTLQKLNDMKYSSSTFEQEILKINDLNNSI